MWRSWGVVLLLFSFSLPSFALNFGKMRADEVAVYVKDLNTGKMVAEHRTDVAMNPASTMKLVTAFAAFRALAHSIAGKLSLKVMAKSWATLCKAIFIGWAVATLCLTKKV